MISGKKQHSWTHSRAPVELTHMLVGQIAGAWQHPRALSSGLHTGISESDRAFIAGSRAGVAAAFPPSIGKSLRFGCLMMLWKNSLVLSYIPGEGPVNWVEIHSGHSVMLIVGVNHPPPPQLSWHRRSPGPSSPQASVLVISSSLPCRIERLGCHWVWEITPSY